MKQIPKRMPLRYGGWSLRLSIHTVLISCLHVTRRHYNHAKILGQMTGEGAGGPIFCITLNLLSAQEG